MNSNETNQPLISVIVPVYNIIPYLPRCVESLQKQTYPELEILLIDDGSTDDTPALCDRLAENDPRLPQGERRSLFCEELRTDAGRRSIRGIRGQR